MRRGHPGVWRGENPRHFRPRGGQPPHFRPPMQFGSQEMPRFQPPGPRFRGQRPYSHPLHSDDVPPDIERPYRGPGGPNIQSRSQGGGNHDRNIFPLIQKRVQDHQSGRPFNGSKRYFEGNSFNTNNLGDVDHRSQDVDHRPHDFDHSPYDVDHRPHDVDHRAPNKYGPRSPWVKPPFERRQYTGQHKNSKQYIGDSSLPDLTGHRPPSSDHYTGTSGLNNNNNPYSRSVDDTVDIVRRRLLNKDSQHNNDESSDQSKVDSDFQQSTNESYHNVPQEQPVKKRIQRQRQEKINCDSMKNKIVHQLFKMDKKKIHKLMDNPNSSSKFEYAISSLITESQNSFNRHLRSVAEKSLPTNNTSSDFIHNDNNTIYEDTFMRQMQGVLDPQDTILLEDIKPLVLAELSKVLCLEDFDGRYQGHNNAYYNQPHEYLQNYGEYGNADHDDFITGDLYDNRHYDDPGQEDRKHNFSQNLSFEEHSSPPLFERRPVKRFSEPQDGSPSRSNDSWHQRQSLDSNSIPNKSNDEITENINEPARPLFDSNCDQLSEDEDPFAELDNQYHVAVDPNFIEQEDGVIVSPVPDRTEFPTHLNTPPATVKTENIYMPTSNDIIRDVDNQLQNIVKSPITLLQSQVDKASKLKIKQEIEKNVAAIKETLLPKTEIDDLNDDVDRKPHSDHVKIESEKYSSRKRSTDSRPSHRKEKRKKSSHSESQDEATSIFNIFFDKKTPEKVNSKDATDKKYSDKYVKRKEPPSKDKHKKIPDSKSEQKKQNSNSSHSITSPNTSSSAGDQTPKADKSKLTAIDIFTGAKPKKATLHQAHRNTSTPLVAKSPDENKIKPIIPVVTTFARKLSKRHIGIQTIVKKLRNRECQTVCHKKATSGTQTDPVIFEKDKPISNNPLERMKEIDMEIQMLLQEKFKLYNSLESKNKTNMSSADSMGTLGMAVLNVPLETDENIDDNDDSLADSIAEDFANLPVEELEEIAMETIIEKKSEKVNRRKHLHLTRKNSESPTTRRKRCKNDTPNISLLEQIISNDKPLEEIISLDDLERTPKRSKKKTTSKHQKKKSEKRVKLQPSTIDLESYNLKECYVVLERIDVSEYLQNRSSLKVRINLKAMHFQETDQASSKSKTSERSLSPVPENNHDDPESQRELKSEELSLQNLQESRSVRPTIEAVEEANDIQIDMMEVCEDIVIGDEVKTVADVIERVPIMEEIILDNSQSSAENIAPETIEGECKMYDYSTDDMLKRDAVTVTGNADAVLAIECIDNSFIAACLDGNVYNYSSDGQLVNTLRGSNLAVTCLTIVKEKYGTTVYTGSLDSRIRYYDLETGLEKGPECNVLSPIQTMDRAWDTIFVGTRTGFVLQFECKNNMLIPVSTVKFSEQSILALRAMKEGPRKVLLVAARSDNVTIKDAQTGLLLRTLEGPKMTVYSLLFEDGKVYCGTSGHQIHVFDYTSGAHVHAHAGGKGAVCLRATGGLVFAGCYDGCVYVFREGEARPLAQLRGPALMLLSLAIHGTKIIAGYKDRSLYIWKIPLAVLQEMIL